MAFCTSFVLVVEVLVASHAKILYDASDRGLTSLPGDIPLDVTDLKLPKNFIHTFADHAFQKFEKLVNIDLSGNGITSISKNVFTGTKIEQLNLSGNLISEFPDLSTIGETLISLWMGSIHLVTIKAEDFTSLVKLKYLSLTYSKNLPKGLPFKLGLHLIGLYLFETYITNITTDFTNLGKMKYLSISYGSFLGDTTDEGFINTTIRDLHLMHMNMKSFPYFPRFAEKIAFLNMEGSTFTEELEPKHFQQFKSLKILRLASCGITKLPNIFTLHGTLTELTLNDNPIRCITKVDPPNGTLTIQLESIEMYCDCCWRWVKELDIAHGQGQQTNLKVILSDEACQGGPAHLKNVPWRDITLDNLTCPETTQETTFDVTTTSKETTTEKIIPTTKPDETTTSSYKVTSPPIDTQTTRLKQQSDDPKTTSKGTTTTTSTAQAVSQNTEVTTLMSEMYSQSPQAYTAAGKWTQLIEEAYTIYTETYLPSTGAEIQLHWNQWLPWTQCTLSCGGGTHFRFMVCASSNNTKCLHDLHSTTSGLKIGYSVHIKDCNTQQCPIDGVWSSWQRWMQCSATCGEGVSRRTRHCVGPLFGGQKCGDEDHENRFCLEENCPQTALKLKSPKPEVTYTEADKRVSAEMIGSSAVIVLAIFGVLILFLDITSFRRHFAYMKRNLKSRF